MCVCVCVCVCVGSNTPMAGLYLWSAPGLATGGVDSYKQYTDTQMGLPLGRYSCVTWVIDLSRVCDPDTSTWAASPEGGFCRCFNGGVCPTWDLTSLPWLFLSFRVRMCACAIILTTMHAWMAHTGS